MPDLNPAALRVIGRIRRYGETKRGPLILRYFAGDPGLRIEATDGAITEAGEIPNSRLDGDEGVTRAMEMIETVLQRLRDARSKQRVAQ